MKLTLKRIALRDTYTIGKLYTDDVYFCDTLEDKVRDLNKNGIFDNGEVKIKGQTAIPYGEYEVNILHNETDVTDVVYDSTSGVISIPHVIGPVVINVTSNI